VKKHVINLHIHIYINNTLTAKNSSDAETNIFNILYNVLDYIQNHYKHEIVFFTFSAWFCFRPLIRKLHRTELLVKSKAR
jgi:hypothetical protein